MLSLPENICCGFFDSSKSMNLKVSPKRIVTQFEIEFYLADGFTTTTDNKVYQIKKNYIQIAKPNQTRHSVLPIKTAYLKFSVSGTIADLLTEAPEYFCSSHPENIYGIINEIILLNERDDIILLHSRILSLLNLVLSDSKIPTAQSGKNYEIVAKAKRYIEAHYNEPLKLKDIACSVFLSDIYFHNIFTTALGISPHQYLINCRIESAKQQLWNTQISIDKIAENTGFGCRQYFNKVFKKEVGTTPALYRKSFQQNYIL